jgi:hypothetical protein
MNFADVWQGKELGSGVLKTSTTELWEWKRKFGRGNGEVSVEMVAEQRSYLSLLYEYGNYN